MGNPYEFRELMKAAFGYSDKTPDQVLAEQKRKNDRTPTSSKGRPAKAAELSTAAPRASELEKMRALMAGAKPRPAPTEG
jgi:hypothetical protein